MSVVISSDSLSNVICLDGSTRWLHCSRTALKHNNTSITLGSPASHCSRFKLGNVVYGLFYFTKSIVYIQTLMNPLAGSADCLQVLDNFLYRGFL